MKRMIVLGMNTRKTIRRLISGTLTITLLLSFCILPSSLIFTAKAASDSDTAESDPPDADRIEVTNNAKGTSDTVYVYGLSPKDTVKVYNAETGGKMLATKTVSSSGSDVTITISQLSADEGSIYVSVTSSGCAESSRTEAAYDAEAESEAPDADDITITNNAKGTSDTVYVCGLSPKDVVKVYNAETDGKKLGSSTVSSSGSDVTVTISQLGSDAGSVYISVTNSNCTESSRTEAAYDAEPGSDPPDTDNITVTNNAKGTSDTVYVCGLSPKDVVKVYNAETGGKKLKNKTVSSSGSDATVTISQLGSDAGSVFISVTSSGCTESSRVEAPYSAESTSEEPDAEFIVVTNNPKGTKDTVCVSGLDEGDVIKVYTDEEDGKQLGKATVSDSKSSVTISISQLGTDEGTVYVSRKSSGSLESDRVAADYDAELVSTALNSSDIAVTNNAKGTADTVYVQNLSSGDIVKVYKTETGTSVLGKATATDAEVTISITQMGTEAGYVYVSVSTDSMGESSRTEVSYDAEAASTAPDTDDIVVTNNPTGTSDTVYVSGLTADDIVKVYNSSSSGTLLGKSTATSTTATITISQLGTSAKSVYVTVTSTGKTESTRTEAEYDAEAASEAPGADNITVTNNASGMADTVYVSGLTSGDVVTVYKASSKATTLGTATVSSGKTSATVSIEQMGTAAGSVYVAVAGTDCLESSCTEVSYSAEVASTALSPSDITVTNNATGTADTVYVTGLSEGDVVTVYEESTLETTLGTATCADSASTVIVSISQLGTDAGGIYVTVAGTGENESTATQAEYEAEAVSTAPDQSNITATNNASGTADTVYVSGLASGDIVTVYKTSNKATTLGTATVSSGVTYATVSIDQIGTGSGVIYVSVICTDSLESDLTEVSYSAEVQTTALSADSVGITNNYGDSDTVIVTGLTAEDVINVYDAATGGTLLGTATVSSSSSKGTITIDQLGTSSGYIYVTITSKNKTESTTTAVGYDAEPQSTAPSESNITLENNSGADDTITVIGLLEGDAVTIYKASSGPAAWETGTVSSSSSTITITVPQLGTSTGYVYISVTSTDASESSRTAAAYLAEEQSTAPSEGDVTVANKYNIASTITVKGLANNDVVNVYGSKTGTTVLGTGTVSSYGSSTTISLSSGVSASGGTLYVTVTSTNKSESARTAVAYSAQTVSTALSSSDATIVNNADIEDTITVKNLSSGAIINVYDAESDGELLGTKTASGTSATISIDQLGESAGSIYMTVTTSGKTESARTKVEYEAESASDALNSGDVTVVNNSGASDTISITGLSSGDVVKVYKASSGGTYIASTTATGDLTTTITISQLGTSSGSTYLTVTTSGKTESSRTEIAYSAESTAPSVTDVTIVNNAGISDTIAVSNLTSGDIVNICSDSTGDTLLGTATASSSDTSVTITISQLSSAAGYVYISVTNRDCAESSLTKVSYLAEQTTDAPDESDIYIENNASGTSDTVTVYSLVSGDIVKVYDESDNLLGKATVSSGNTSATVTISELGSSGGTICISVKTKGKLESDTTAYTFSSEIQSAAPYAGNVAVINNSSSADDTVTVAGLAATDYIKVYNASSSGTLLGYATVTSGSTSVTISISQLGTAAGTIYVSVTSVGKTESYRTAVDYVAEESSSTIDASNVTITNNASGTADTIIITGLSSGDFIQVYDQESNGNLLGTATASSSGTITVSIAQLGTLSGYVYITRTSAGKSESQSIAVKYEGEA